MITTEPIYDAFNIDASEMSFNEEVKNRSASSMAQQPILTPPPVAPFTNMV